MNISFSLWGWGEAATGFVLDFRVLLGLFMVDGWG